MRDDLLRSISESVADGDQEAALEAVDKAIEVGIPLLDILNEGATKGMDIVNERYDNGDAFLPELVISGDTMTEVVNKIFSMMGNDAPKKAGIVVIGQAEGDVHDIGKSVVCAMLRVNGFEVYDLGVNVPVKAFIEKAKEVKANIIAMSTLMTASMPFLRDLPKYLNEIELRDKYYYIVGGGPVNSDFAVKIGADGWGRSAFDAVNVCKELMEGKIQPAAKTVVIDQETGIK